MIRLVLTVLCFVSLAAPTTAQLVCKVSKYGKGCGPTLTAKVSPRGNTNHVSLTVAKANPSSRLVFMVGASRLDMPLAVILPNALASCRLLVVPVFLQQHRPRQNGMYTYARSLPSTAAGVGHAQFLELRTDGKVLATNGITLDCK